MASPMERVFRVTELLENILCSLSQKDLLLSQRVSTTFRDTVKSSLKLQRALFFAPDWKLETRAFDAYASDNRPGRRPENNRLLLRAFPGSYPTITLVVTQRPKSKRHITPPDGPVDSGYDSASSTENINYGRRGSEQWSWDCCISFPADKLPLCHASVHHPEASWRRMYLSQPPSESLFLVRRWQRSRRPAMIRDGGITMGDFVDETTREQPGWHPSYVSSDRDWHFEGNIKCSGIEAQRTDCSAPFEEDFTYVFFRAEGDTIVRTLSDEWRPER